VAPRIRSPLFAIGETVVSVGPEDVRPAPPPDDRVVCFTCGGTEWAEDWTFDWKLRGDVTRIRNALTLRCVNCGRHRRARP